MPGFSYPVCNQTGGKSFCLLSFFHLEISSCFASISNILPQASHTIKEKLLIRANVRAEMIEDTFIKNDTDIQIGSNIKKIRIAKGMRPSDLVREVNLRGISMTIFSLSKIEANTQHVKASQL